MVHLPPVYNAGKIPTQALDIKPYFLPDIPITVNVKKPEPSFSSHQPEEPIKNLDEALIIGHENELFPKPNEIKHELDPISSKPDHPEPFLESHIEPFQEQHKQEEEHHLPSPIDDFHSIDYFDSTPPQDEVAQGFVSVQLDFEDDKSSTDFGHFPKEVESQFTLPDFTHPLFEESDQFSHDRVKEEEKVPLQPNFEPHLLIKPSRPHIFHKHEDFIPSNPPFFHRRNLALEESLTDFLPVKVRTRPVHESFS